MTAAATPTASAGAVAGERPLLRPPAPLPLRAADVDGDTMSGVILRQNERYGDRPAVRIKRDGRWLEVSWHEVGESALAAAAALVHAGVGRGDRVALLSENRLEWLYVDQGAQLAGTVVVPIYSSSTPDMIEQILRDSEASALVCSTPAQAAKVAEIRESCPSLRACILLEGDADGFTLLADLTAQSTADDVEEVGRRARAITPDDALTIIYTSGTTGVPKGVVLTNHNVVSNCRSMLEVVPIDDTDVGISFLPWAHVYERVQGLFTGLMAGVSSAIATDMNDIGGDLRAVRPTLMNGVPRMYEKMQEAIENRIRSAGGRRAQIGMRALQDAVDAARLRRAGRPVPLTLRLRLPLWERLVLKQVREGLGGRARLFSSGGGPINIATLEFFDALGVAITEGYGLTETCGGIFCNVVGQQRFGTVGRPTPGHEVRIAEDGEILVSGPSIMQGYFHNDDATREVIQDGWFHTGDIGEMDADGYLRITDRKKDLIVTAGGKNIAPQPIEALIMQNPLVERATVIGDRRKYLVALVVPAYGALRDWARRNGVAASSPEEFARDPKVGDLYTRIAAEASQRLARYETIKKVAVLDRDLSPEAGELTPTLKVRRNVVQRSFADTIEALYR